MANDPSRPGAAKARRSRNGCNECRRLHRRCDETRPQCKACVRDEKVCSYQRDHVWVIGSSRKGPRKDRKIVEPTTDHAATDLTAFNAPPRSTHADVVEELRLPGYTPVGWLPWLSHRHRMLVAHFANVTCSTFFLNTKAHHELCSALMPLVVESHSSFHLIAAILCLASRHLKALDVSSDDGEAAYWEATAVGHLRRQVPLRDEASEGTLAATALLLSLHDIYAGGERTGSWRMHLEGALAILDRPSIRHDPAFSRLHAIGLACSRLASVFSRPRLAGASIAANHCTSSAHFATCDHVDELLSVSAAIFHTLMDVERVASEMTALMHMERCAQHDREEIDALWSPLLLRVQNVLNESHHLTAALGAASIAEILESAEAPTEEQEIELLNEAYRHITLSQIQLHLMGCETHHEAVQGHLISAMKCLQKIQLHDHACPGMALLQPAFVVGCYALDGELRRQAVAVLDSMKKSHGRQNAVMAREFLLEFWQCKDLDLMPKSTPRLDWRQSLEVSHRAPELEWTDLMAQKDWDLSLW